jgi:hypothetical protein
MTEQQFTADYEAPEADAAEQSMQVDELDEQGDEQERGAAASAQAPGEPALELPWEADPADAVEQAVPVPVDEDEYR